MAQSAALQPCAYNGLLKAAFGWIGSARIEAEVIDDIIIFKSTQKLLINKSFFKVNVLFKLIYY